MDCECWALPPLVARGSEVHVCALTHSPLATQTTLYWHSVRYSTVSVWLHACHVWYAVVRCPGAAPRCCRWGRVGGIFGTRMQPLLSAVESEAE